MELKDKLVLVAGAGISGIGAVGLLKTAGAEVVLYDGNDKLDEEVLYEKMRVSCVQDFDDVDVVLGEFPEALAEQIDLCVISPGIPLDVPFVTFLRNKNKPIWGEIELAYRCSKGKVIGITGTNGKTTTTALTGKIMADYYESTFVVGNIGTPFTLMAGKTKDTSVTVAEISSFQLETIEEFAPCVSAILNITPDHLNRHKTMECYIDTKLSITKNQTEDQVCILNYEDEVLRKRSQDIKCQVVFFSSKTKLENGIYMDKNGDIYLAGNGQNSFLMNTREMKLVGAHNAENVMAAIGIAEAMKVPKEIYLNTIRNFEAIEHRIEYVKTVNNVVYYNDSKGTNTDASKKALEAMDHKTVLIAGGYDKGSEYDDWVEAFGDKIKCLVLLGATREKIAETARKHGFTNIKMVNSLKEAVKVSAQEAKSGETVLLSPACASWDMFKSYEERGKLFKQYVRELE
ncbi:MAG: UDP-N-acetylmuramoyl-L-alanine--D-glutamate ligase [Lachnospiraceae bacterium]|nr:UDP-N-acetylmuramoyl-L-alanine--D-glutamate ligase [Lachnospiraceae bacterium]